MKGPIIRRFAEGSARRTLKPPTKSRTRVTITVYGKYQCADTASTAFGLGIEVPRSVQPSVQVLLANAFIGLPCPKKMAGIGFVMSIPFA
jgi:hypothetical protein